MVSTSFLGEGQLRLASHYVGVPGAASVALTYLLLLAGALLLPRSAQAYPWMIRHDYTGCATCHVDPSGGGVLTAYGSAQGDMLLRTRYGARAAMT